MEHISQQEATDLVWKEHEVAHLGAWKVFKALGRKGYKIPYSFVRMTLKGCEICAKFREEKMRDQWHSLLYSDEPGGVVYVDFTGPLLPGCGGVKYIQCIVDSATRVAHATKHKTADAMAAIKGLDQG